MVDRVVQVRERDPEEDVVYWSQRVLGMSLAYDHSMVSTECHVSRLSEVKIPLEGRPWLGGPLVS